MFPTFSEEVIPEQNKTNFSKLDRFLFEEVEPSQEEKITGGGIGTSPSRNLAHPQEGHRAWAYGFLF